MSDGRVKLTGNELLRIFEALSNPYRLKLISILTKERKYVSQLAREMKMSRPLLYMHLRRLEEAGIVSSQLELSEDGKAMKYVQIVPFELHLTHELIADAAETLTVDRKTKQADDEEV
ncbi:MAG: transcriptional regulator [Bacillus thermozeamaize]|jgi:predicted transcriptional regulator|uniref:Transcriptional regulator n=1 Tax=Bacillus thermozeamaize TaxID=230954 RepID=A0A1Y3PP77_9BACI|nr:MAG: transcriptional regulator [Bacillus thermozeamaize]